MARETSFVLHVLHRHGQTMLGGEPVHIDELTRLHDEVVAIYRVPVPDGVRAVDKHTLLYADALVNLGYALARRESRNIAIFGGAVASLIYFIRDDAYEAMVRHHNARATP